MDIVSLLIQLASGAIGGNLAGTLLKKMSLGLLGNTLAGIVGGGLGGQILEQVLGVGTATAASGLDLGSLIPQIAGGGVGGGMLMIVVAILRKLFAK